MYTNVLVPIDLSHAERFPGMFESARSLAEDRKAQITLLHVFAEVPGYVVAQIPPQYHESYAKDAEKSLKDLVSKYDLKGDVKVLVKDGHVANTILQTAKETGADLIVVGSHKPGPSDYLIGSVAGRIVRHASCSVVVVR